jgi:peptide/nickel transport system ATP-binding protein
MYGGRVVERAESNALFRAPRHPYTLGLLGSFPPLHGPRHHMSGIPGSPPDLGHPPDGCRFNPRCGYVMDRCRTQLPPLAAPPGPRETKRLVACWLQDPASTDPVPDELARPQRAPGGAERARTAQTTVTEETA